MPWCGPTDGIRIRDLLIERVSSLVDPASPHTLWFAGHALFWVDLDSLAPTYTPHDLFHSDSGVRLVAPWNTGYVVEVPLASRAALLQRLRPPSTTPQRVDISRIVSVRPLHKEITPDSLKQAWATAALDGPGGARRVHRLPAALPVHRRATRFWTISGAGWPSSR